MQTGNILVTVQYKPMLLSEYNSLFDLPAPESDAEGFLEREPDGSMRWVAATDFFLHTDPEPIPEPVPVEPAPQPTENLVFGMALEMMKLGHKTTRAAWPEGVTLAVQEPTAGERITKPYLCLSLDGDAAVAHFADVDLLANDWKIVE